MRLNLFLKAKYFLDTKQIKVLSVSDHSISFAVGNYHVVGKYINHQLYWLCDCKADANNDLCSHKIAAQTYLTFNTPQLKQMDSSRNPEEITARENPIGYSMPVGLIHLTESQKLALRQMVCFRCQDCHKHEDEVGKLEPHRITRGADGGLYIPQNIKMLCKGCHDVYDY